MKNPQSFLQLQYKMISMKEMFTTTFWKHPKAMASGAEEGEMLRTSYEINKKRGSLEVNLTVHSLLGVPTRQKLRCHSRGHNLARALSCTGATRNEQAQHAALSLQLQQSLVTSSSSSSLSSSSSSSSLLDSQWWWFRRHVTSRNYIGQSLISPRKS